MYSPGSYRTRNCVKHRKSFVSPKKHLPQNFQDPVSILKVVPGKDNLNLGGIGS